MGLRDELRAAFAKLKDEQKDSPDWHPGTDEKVLDLVHPSMYPLVYGRSRVFADEVVGVHGAVDRWSGKGAVIDVPPSNSNGRFRFGQTDPLSTNYQWLPSNVKFQDDGTVKFTSYINGLHPNKHSDVYVTIEKLIQRALPTWDLCLVRSREWPSPNEPSEGEIPENVAWEDLVFEDEPSMDESLAHELSHKYDAARTAPRFPKPENPEYVELPR